MAKPGSLTFSITPAIPLPSTGSLMFTFPSSFTLGSISCSNLQTGASCAKNGLIVTITSTSAFTFPITGTISGLTMPSIPLSSAIYI